MARLGNNRSILNVRIDIHTQAALEGFASANNLTLSQAARLAISTGLDRITENLDQKFVSTAIQQGLIEGQRRIFDTMLQAMQDLMSEIKP